MRRFIVFVAAAVLFSSAALAQVSSKDFNERYQLLVSKLGPSGVGVETLINRWEAAYPDDIEMLQDLVVMAVNDAIAQIDVETEKKLGKYAKGLPGF